VKFDIVQQSAISPPQASPTPASASQAEVSASIEAPISETGNAAPVARWKSMTTGTIRTLRFEGDYIYGETVLSEAAAKAGSFSSWTSRKMEISTSASKWKGCKVGRRCILSDRVADGTHPSNC